MNDENEPKLTELDKEFLSWDLRPNRSRKHDKVMNEMGKILLQGTANQKGSPKFIPNEFGSAPICYDKLIFFDTEKEKEWEELEPDIKESYLKNLKETCSKMQNKLAIELLCHVINDMEERIKRLEKDANI